MRKLACCVVPAMLMAGPAVGAIVEPGVYSVAPTELGPGVTGIDCQSVTFWRTLTQAPRNKSGSQTRAVSNVLQVCTELTKSSSTAFQSSCVEYDTATGNLQRTFTMFGTRTIYFADAGSFMQTLSVTIPEDRNCSYVEKSIGIKTGQ
jgi:hypothetical protein